ncbi:MAG: hypothetical protein IJS14_05910 [Lentisphaeria bacterium]|nr:hypothetical protein [Lentisphaeria bacterium]
MEKKYFALKASLPMLMFDSAPPMSSAEFLARCEVFVAPDLMAELRTLTEIPREASKQKKNRFLPNSREAMEIYLGWEISLRNALARLRAIRLGRDPEAWQVPADCYDLDAEAAARASFNAGNPLEKEKFLDRARWNFLDGLEWNHAFDFSGLCIYLCKLLILEKWAARAAGNAAENLNAAADRAEKASENGKSIS